MRRFVDRIEAGVALAERLTSEFAGAVIAGVPRGGVPVAVEVAVALSSPLDPIVVRKVGAPAHRELAMGAVGEFGVTVIEREVLRSQHVTDEQFSEVAESERRELERRARLYRGTKEPVSMEGRTVVIVDDGIATGSSMRAACEVARRRGATRLVIATPVSSFDAKRRLSREVDYFVALLVIEGPFAVGNWYSHFEQTSDQHVLDCLARAGRQ